jgi:DNA-binding SARP family transcriptional activator
MPSPTPCRELPARLEELLPAEPDVRDEYAALLEELRETGGESSIAELTRRLADASASTERASADPTDRYRETYLSLQRTQVPLLTAVGIVEYDETDGTISLTTDEVGHRCGSR